MLKLDIYMEKNWIADLLFKKGVAKETVKFFTTSKPGIVVNVGSINYSYKKMYQFFGELFA